MSAAEIDNAIQNIRKATKGLGTDEKGLIDALVHLPPHVLPHLDAHYKANYGSPLEEVLKKETSGTFGKLLRAVVLDEPVVAARTIHKACEGMGANTKLVAEVPYYIVIASSHICSVVVLMFGGDSTDWLVVTISPCEIPIPKSILVSRWTQQCRIEGHPCRVQE